MSFALLIFKSAFRNRLRALLTSSGVAIAIIAFLLLRAFLAAYHAGVENSASDRLITRNKISIIFPLPLAYVTKVRGMVGERGAVAYENWFGAQYPKDEHAFFGSLAASREAFTLYPEIVAPPADMKAYDEDRTGALVGVDLAAKYGWKLGDRVRLRGTIYPGDWDFTVRAIYHSTSRGIDQATFFFHWEYLNERVVDRIKDRAGLILIKVNDPNQSIAVSQQIDQAFANSDSETRTESEKAFQLEFLSMASAVLSAIEVVSAVVLAILILILANTLAMATRERTTEYAVMRAIGFQPRHIVTMVVGEAFVVSFTGVALGVLLAGPVMKVFEQQLSKSFGAFIGAFSVEPGMIAACAGVAVVAATVASALPARRARRLNIVDALRRVE